MSDVITFGELLDVRVAELTAAIAELESRKPTLAAGTLAAGTSDIPFVPADPARFNNRDLMTAKQAEDLARCLATSGKSPGYVREALNAFGWDLEPVFDVIDGGKV